MNSQGEDSSLKSLLSHSECFLVIQLQQKWPPVFWKKDTLLNKSAVKNSQICCVYLSIFVLGDRTLLLNKVTVYYCSCVCVCVYLCMHTEAWKIDVCAHMAQTMWALTPSSKQLKKKQDDWAQQPVRLLIKERPSFRTKSNKTSSLASLSSLFFFLSQCLLLSFCMASVTKWECQWQRRGSRKDDGKDEDCRKIWAERKKGRILDKGVTGGIQSPSKKLRKDEGMNGWIEENNKRTSRQKNRWR